MAFWKSKQKPSGAPPADEPDRFDQTAEIDPVQYDDDDDDDGDEKTQLLTGPRPTAAQVQQAIRRSEMTRNGSSEFVNPPSAPKEDWADEATAIGRSILPRMSHPAMVAAGRTPVPRGEAHKPPLTPEEEFALDEEDVDVSLEEDFDSEESSTPIPPPTSSARMAQSSRGESIVPGASASIEAETSKRRRGSSEHRVARARVEIPPSKQDNFLEESEEKASRSREPSDDITMKASAIELIVFDVDGTLTDGGLFYGVQGEVLKRFCVHDGHGIVLAKRAGLKIALLTARNSQIVKFRAKELGIENVFQGQKDKVAGFQALLAETDIPAERVAYMGDDLNDLGPLSSSGFSACPANACLDIQERVDFVSTKEGGCGAAREFIEVILKAQKKWDGLIEDAITGK